jgi:hypothetical protein
VEKKRSSLSLANICYTMVSGNSHALRRLSHTCFIKQYEYFSVMQLARFFYVTMCQVAFLLFFFYLKKGIEINFGYFFFKENEYNLFYLANKKKYI